MGNPTKSKIPTVHFENLDALRFFAAFSVLIFHYFRDIDAYYPTLHYNKIYEVVSSIADKGMLGVNFFFVLSGFLITYLVLHEREHTGKFSYGKFLIRRTLRIWPLYYIILFFGFILFPLVFDHYYTVHNGMNYAFFLANFDEIWYGLNDPINFLTSPWSVAVEEQFYLFWGLALYLLLRLKKFPLEFILIILYVISFTFRTMYIDEERVIYYHTLSVCQDLITGCLVGLSLFKRRSWLDKIQNISKPGVIAIYLVGFTVCILKNKIFQGDYLVFERFVLSLFFAFIILDQTRGKYSFIKVGRIKVFNYLGKISYGIYMYHLVIMYVLVYFINSEGWTGYWIMFAYFIGAVILTILTASLSYRFIEKRFLSLKPH